MHYRHTGVKHRARHFTDAAAEVEVLGIHEVSLVKASGLFQRRAAHKHEASR